MTRKILENAACYSVVVLIGLAYTQCLITFAAGTV